MMKAQNVKKCATPGDGPLQQPHLAEDLDDLRRAAPGQVASRRPGDGWPLAISRQEEHHAAGGDRQAARR